MSCLCDLRQKTYAEGEEVAPRDTERLFLSLYVHVALQDPFYFIFLHVGHR